MEFRTYNFEKLIDKKAESKFKGIGLLTNHYLKEGNYPIVDQGKSLTNGYTNDNSKVISVEKPIIIFGDHTRIFKFIDFDFAPGADGTKVIVPNYKLINPKLFYLLLKNSKIPNDGYGRHYKHLKELEFNMPCDFKKQEELANILSNKLSSLEKMRLAALTQLEAIEALPAAILREVFEFKNN
jgi:type I restriction enzyme S subunit